MKLPVFKYKHFVQDLKPIDKIAYYNSYLREYANDSMAFRRVLSFWDIFWLGIGGMVGVAILTFPAATYQMAGPSSIISWVLAGIFSLLMAFIYCEMVTAFPESGALVIFPYVAFGKGLLARYLAYLEGIGYYIGTVFGIVISAIILGNYISPYFSTGIGQIAIAEISLLIVGIINLFGVKVTSKANLIMSVLFMLVFVAIIILALTHGNFSNLHPFISGANGSMGILLAIPIAILAYGAWTALLTIPEETVEIEKIPRAVFWSIIVVTVFYALLVLATYVGLTSSQISKFPESPVYGLVLTLNNSSLLLIFQIAAVLAIVAVMLVMVLANARILFALTKLEFLPKSIGKMSSNSIPIYATLLSFLIPMILSIFPGYYFQYVVIGAIIGTGLPRIIDLASYLMIRGRSDYKPKYRVRHGFIIASLAFFGLLVSELSLGWNDFVWSAAAFVIITILFVLIEWRRR